MRRSGVRWCVAILLGVAAAAPVRAGVTLVEGGQARCAIYVSPGVTSTKDSNPQYLKGAAREAEVERQRLRESVKDLAFYLGKMSGSQVDIFNGDASASGEPVPIFIGDMAAKVFGPVGKSYPFKQGFRVVIGPHGVGLYGESDLASSYAIYELLDRLGCRWYMPSDTGAVIPSLPTIRLDNLDFRSAPATIYRGGPGSGNSAFGRRNRGGGMPTGLGFGSVEGRISAAQLRQHPEWVAIIGGKPDPGRLRWSNPAVAQAIAAQILGQQAVDPEPTTSFILGGGVDFDQSPEDRALDSGDIDPVFGDVSVSDRLLVLTNRVADALAAKSCDTLLMMSAYTKALRAPRREKVHAHIVPVIVASVYDRWHPLTDDAAPGNTDLRHAIEGWGKAAGMIGDYAYTYNLGESTAPNPMIALWSVDVPFFLKNGCRFWMPEAPANLEAGLPGEYLTYRLTWDPAQDPGAVIDRMMTDLYGHAGPPMKAYWTFMDNAWAKAPVYTGAEFGYTQRFTPAVMAEARRLMDAGVAAVQTEHERFFVKMADGSLGCFEQFMALRNDLDAGRFAGLKARSDARHQRLMALANQYASQGAFASGRGTPAMTRALIDADRIQARFNILTPHPLRAWRYQPDRAQKGAALGFARPGFDDAAWKTTDPCVQTWSTLGLHNYYGAVWYRCGVDLPAVPPGKKVYLWISGTDGSAEVFVNGKAIPYGGLTGQADATPKGAQAAVFSGFAQPVSFDISGAAVAGGANQVAILCRRTELNELGTGGLLGPVVIYAER